MTRRCRAKSMPWSDGSNLPMTPRMVEALQAVMIHRTYVAAAEAMGITPVRVRALVIQAAKRGKHIDGWARAQLGR
jgi:hypothetical protein